MWYSVVALVTDIVQLTCPGREEEYGSVKMSTGGAGSILHPFGNISVTWWNEHRSLLSTISNPPFPPDSHISNRNLFNAYAPPGTSRRTGAYQTPPAESFLAQTPNRHSASRPPPPSSSSSSRSTSKETESSRRSGLVCRTHRPGPGLIDYPPSSASDPRWHTDGKSAATLHSACQTHRGH